METTEILEILQLLHAGDRIDALARFECNGLVEEITTRSRLEDRIAAPARVRQFGLCTPDQVFQFQSLIFGHTRWHCTPERHGIVAIAEMCKLRDIARARRTAPPCEYCCTDPLAALCAALPSPAVLSVVSTLWRADNCRILLTPIHSHLSQDQQ